MRQGKVYLFFFIILIATPAHCDEGMWLLQLLKQQHTIDRMKEQGLLLEADSLYNSQGTSIKDAVGIFGGGCTGEIISSQGLILTNHHCGYSSIQQHSSVEHDYLTDGFWAMSKEDELPTPGLRFTFITRIEDVTDIVQSKIDHGEITETESLGSPFLTTLAAELLEKSDLNGHKGIHAQALPFYAGNKFYLIYKKIYTDIRMVAAPPASVGKFGGETDNWMWPRHTGDFSLFRIYADQNGDPADYNVNNVPLETKQYFTISLNGTSENDYAMILGFPGSTSRYLTVTEVKERMESINNPLINVRTARLEVLRKLMGDNDAIRIQYANKFASSSNYWKNSIGMNKAIMDNNVLGLKTNQELRFNEFAEQKQDSLYISVIERINNVVSATAPLKYRINMLRESFFTAVEFNTPYKVMDNLIEGLLVRNDSIIQANVEMLKKEYEHIQNKDYNHDVDKQVAEAIFPLYASLTPLEERPAFYQTIEKDYHGDYGKYITELYDNSIFSNRTNLEAFLAKPTVKAIQNDLCYRFSKTKSETVKQLQEELKTYNDELAILHKTYIRGLSEMDPDTPPYPDANFTIRLTYGNVKSYAPKDGVRYRYYTTTKGILEKENPQSTEFMVPAKLKELITKADYGPYAMEDGTMPVCFLTTNDITGGNSGSPVIDSQGRLIGVAFDGNWESLSGDIHFDNNLQRCIALDIRYMLFILDKLGGCQHLINEMRLVR